MGWEDPLPLRKEEVVVVNRVVAVALEGEEGLGISPSAHGVSPQ